MLSYADYIVLAVALLISASIGIYYRRQTDANDYLLAGGTMSPFPVAFSLMASFMSAITLLGVTNENFAYGTQFIVINISYAIGTPIAAYVYLPVFFRMKSPSAYGYLEKRFGIATRIVASLAFSLQMILYMGIVLYAPALALSAVTEMSYLGSILSVGLVCTFYSTLGGIKAVLITDVFQSFLMFLGIGSVAFGGTFIVGGVTEVFALAQDRLQFFDMSLDPTIRHTFWTQSIGGMFIFLSIYAVNQAQVQRLLATKSVKSAQTALWLQWPILATLSCVTSYAGLVMYAHYKGCDPIKLKRIVKGDQLLPLFVVDTMSDKPGLAGLFITGIFSGSLSSVSSAINSLAAVTLEDYMKPFVVIKPDSETLILKILALTYGLACVIFTFLVEFLGPGILQASLTIFGVVGGPLLGLFSLGMMTTRANQRGALIGFISSLVLLFWIGFGRPKPPVIPLPTFANGTDCQFKMNITEPITTAFDKGVDKNNEDYFYPYCISYAWYAMIGTFFTFIIGYLASFIFQEQDKTKQLHPDLFISPIRNKLLRNDQNFINISTGEKTDNVVKSLELLPIAVDVPDKT